MKFASVYIIQDDIVKKNIMEKMDYIIVGVMLLLSLSCCISEALARNCTRVLMVLTVFRCVMEPAILVKLKHAKSILYSMLAFFSAMIISAVYGGHFFELINENVFWYQYSALLLPVCLLCVKSLKHVRVFLYGIFVSMLLTDMYIFYQTYNGVFRPSALLTLGVMTATVLKMVVLPAMVAMIFDKAITLMEQSLLILATCISVAGLICLNTRGGWIAFFPVGLLILLYLVQGWKRKIAMLATCCLVSFLILASFPSVFVRVDSIVHSESQQSATERKLMWESAYKMGMDNPVLGVGKGNYAYKYQHEYINPLAKEPTQGHAHSNFFQMFGENGFLGLSTYCIMMAIIALCGWKYRKKVFGVIMLGATMAFVLYGVTDYTLATYGGMRVYWLLMGLCVASIHLDE